tara:strand:+ start:5 stop:451 length:447 start_codon:yes stop_codon:yes gene_type:complete
MKLNLITTQLYNALPKKDPLKNIKQVSPESFDTVYNLFKNKNIEEINITDLTSSKLIKEREKVKVRDHINKTGSNLIIGKQTFLKLDFIDLSQIYNYDNKSIVTTCCGKYLDKKFNYPSHYLSNITILAHALKIESINAYLYNLHKIN